MDSRKRLTMDSLGCPTDLLTKQLIHSDGDSSIRKKKTQGCLVHLGRSAGRNPWDYLPNTGVPITADQLFGEEIGQGQDGATDKQRITHHTARQTFVPVSLCITLWIGWCTDAPIPWDKRLGGHPSSEETTDPPPQEEVEIPQSQHEEEEEDVVEIVTTSGDRDVVDPDNFTSESAQILIGEIMGCNRDLENIQKNINDVKKKNEEHHVLGRV
ncbi:uncharacterized protein [Aquarana catesbeiana]|uniref:uncharacterized protein n=1 Tax=Aquarana catesbeiana TaxID=8400 RepID=UPI003CC946AD